MIREGYLNIKNRNIWYSVYGHDRPALSLLVVHGGPGFLTLPQVICELADERPVYFYDQLGCGHSQRAADISEYTVENYIEELSEVRSGLGLNEVVLLGQSWGAALVCSYMLEKKPAGVRGLILSGPLLSSPRWNADQRENIARLPAEIRKDIEEGEKSGDYGERYQNAMMDYYKRHICLIDPWPDFLTESLSRMSLEVYLKLWGPSEFTNTGILKTLNLMPRLKEITVPVLLTGGDRDEAGVATLKDYQTAFTAAGLAVLPVASHMHHLEQPRIYQAVVRDFLNRVETGLNK